MATSAKNGPEAYAGRDFVKEHYQQFVGRTITSVQRFTAEELEEMGWEYYDRGEAVALIFDNGEAWAVPTSDPEGNGPGWMDFGIVE